MLVNDECSSWYNRVADFLISVWKGEKKRYVAVDQGSFFIVITLQPGKLHSCGHAFGPKVVTDESH